MNLEDHHIQLPNSITNFILMHVKLAGGSVLALVMQM